MTDPLREALARGGIRCATEGHHPLRSASCPTCKMLAALADQPSPSEPNLVDDCDHSWKPYCKYCAPSSPSEPEFYDDGQRIMPDDVPPSPSEPTPLMVFGRAVGLVLAERKVPNEWDADNLSPTQMLAATVTLLDRLDDATDEYLAAKGSDHRTGRSMQASLRAIVPNEHPVGCKCLDGRYCAVQAFGPGDPRPLPSPSEGPLDVERLIRDLARRSGYIKAGEAMLREYAALASPSPATEEGTP